MGVFTSLLFSGLKLTTGVVLEGLECFRVWVFNVFGGLKLRFALFQLIWNQLII